MLIEQTYADNPDRRRKHYEYLCEAFSDSRYIKHQGLPFFQIYIPEAIGERIEAYLGGLRDFAVQNLGTEIHISAFVSKWLPDWQYLKCFDSATLFQPSASLFAPIDIFASPSTSGVRLGVRLRALSPKLKKPLYFLRDFLPSRYKQYCYDTTWRNLIDQYVASHGKSAVPLNPMAFVNFDNTPRYRSRARLFDNYNVSKFTAYLAELTTIANAVSPDSIMFINAWNEWGEGAFLQPDIAEQYSRLKAVAHAKSRI